MAKYKVNDYVKVTFYPDVHVFQIFEIVETTCSAGTQTMYKGRVNGVNSDGMLYYSKEGTAGEVREIEIVGLAKQEDVWDEAARIRAERKEL